MHPVNINFALEEKNIGFPPWRKKQELCLETPEISLAERGWFSCSSGLIVVWKYGFLYVWDSNHLKLFLKWEIFKIDFWHIKYDLHFGISTIKF